MSQLFGIVPAGLPVLTVPTETPSPTSFVYAIPSPPASLSPPAAAAGKPAFSHVVVFLLPGVQLPPGTAAAIYLVTPPTAPGQTAPSSRFLGGIGPGKESAIFKLGGGHQTATATTTTSSTILGISIEDAASVAARIEEKTAAAAKSSSSGSTALVPATAAAAAAPSTLVLAQRIIQNAFNFLASYSSGGSASTEVVPLRAFEEWWRKFEGRVRSDPTFLERASD